MINKQFYGSLLDAINKVTTEVLELVGYPV